MSAPAADTRCPRCGGAFHCGAQDATPCTSVLQADLRQRYSGCLCLACLRALASGSERERAEGGLPAV